MSPSNVLLTIIEKEEHLLCFHNVEESFTKIGIWSRLFPKYNRLFKLYLSSQIW